MSTISGPPAMLVSNEGLPPPPPITSEQVLGLLIGKNKEDKFYFGRSLFEYDYHETGRDNVGHDSLHTTYYDEKLKDEGYNVSASIFFCTTRES